jgi:hypothetical protein
VRLFSAQRDANPAPSRRALGPPRFPIDAGSMRERARRGARREPAPRSREESWEKNDLVPQRVPRGARRVKKATRGVLARVFFAFAARRAPFPSRADRDLPHLT